MDTIAPPLLFVLSHVYDDDGTFTSTMALEAVTARDPAHVGQVISGQEADGIELGEEVGALWWDVSTGRCERVYVPPWWRRRGIGTVLLRTAGDAARQIGAPDVVVASLRTALGEVWVRATGATAEPLTALSSPLTPACDIEGVTDPRLLVPDDPNALRQVVEEVAAGTDAGRAVSKTLDTACGPALGVPLHRWRQ